MSRQISSAHYKTKHTHTLFMLIFIEPAISKPLIKFTTLGHTRGPEGKQSSITSSLYTLHHSDPPPPPQILFFPLSTIPRLEPRSIRIYDASWPGYRLRTLWPTRITLRWRQLPGFPRLLAFSSKIIPPDTDGMNHSKSRQRLFSYALTVNKYSIPEYLVAHDKLFRRQQWSIIITAITTRTECNDVCVWRRLM